MCKRCRCNHKLNKCPKDVYVKFVSTSAPFTHVWTPSLWVHRHRLHMYELLKRTVYYLQFFHVNLFPILIIKLISGLLSIGHYRSFPSAAAILFMLVIQQTFIELWTDQKRKSSSSYERIKNKQVTVLLSNQKARKRYKLIL